MTVTTDTYVTVDTDISGNAVNTVGVRVASFTGACFKDNSAPFNSATVFASRGGGGFEVEII